MLISLFNIILSHQLLRRLPCFGVILTKCLMGVELLFLLKIIVGFMPARKKKVFLFFWTSIRYLPLESFRCLDSRLCISRTSESCQHLPSAQTRFYQLCITSYCDRVVMQIGSISSPKNILVASMVTYDQT
ncbi:hypothetical protein H5410_035666 [Solanum commersonii]|uniref:HECT-type E3 ubiquitin transferase n=1 Tax=Solanum commersonii TaxID=4109 RepID=A0A9J5Y398_SOLCO|nr:hypothetical protein H5410_035666 [Solanum commersonii]